MAVRHPLSVVLIVFSALAVVFVVAGMCTPGWLILTITRTTPVYEERLSEQKTTINIGFNPYYAWAEECVSTGRNGQMSAPQCAEQTVDYSKIGEEGQCKYVHVCGFSFRTSVDLSAAIMLYS